MTTSWQKQLQLSVTDPQQLLAQLELDPALLKGAQQATQLFSLRVPLGFIELMEKGNPADPLLRQVLPLEDELLEVAGFTRDPLNEEKANPLPGLLHKYHGRVLLTVAGACGVQCRYCFRRHFAYTENNPSLKAWDKVIDYITADSSITEVIYSGGDPLLANDSYLQQLTAKLLKIPHLHTLRIHSRMPVVIPERITDELLSWFAGHRLKPVLVLHCNHANEISQALINACAKLCKAGVTLLNQSVLLKGVNDSTETLAALSHRLFECGVLPYYLHQLDSVQGAAHFAVTEQEAQKIYDGLLAKLPGYLVPKFVVEEPEASSKTPIILNLPNKQ